MNYNVLGEAKFLSLSMVLPTTLSAVETLLNVVQARLLVCLPVIRMTIVFSLCLVAELNLPLHN